MTTIRLRLYVIDRSGAVQDVLDAYPASFYSWLPDWLAQYPQCHIRAITINEYGRLVP